MVEAGDPAAAGVVVVSVVVEALEAVAGLVEVLAEVATLVVEVREAVGKLLSRASTVSQLW